MERFEVLNLESEARWFEMLKKAGIYDVYHLPAYHRLSEITDGDKGILLAFSKDGWIVLFPLTVLTLY